MQFLKSPLVLAVATSMLILTGCNADKDAKSAAAVTQAESVATVNGTPISKGSVDLIVKQGQSQQQQDTPEARDAITNQLIMQTLIADEAVKKGLDKSQTVTDQMNVIRISVLSNAYIEDYLNNNKPTDEQLKAEYDRIKAGIVGTEYKARHILVESDAEAKAIIAQLKIDPAAFAKLAQEKSIDTGSKATGGDLGWFDLSSMVPEFGSAAAKLQKGQLSPEPVKTQYGYHVIMLDDSRPIEPPPFEEVKDDLVESVQQLNLKKVVEDLKAKAKIEMTATAAPAPAGPATAPAEPTVEPAK